MNMITMKAGAAIVSFSSKSEEHPFWNQDSNLFWKHLALKMFWNLDFRLFWAEMSFFKIKPFSNINTYPVSISLHTKSGLGYPSHLNIIISYIICWYKNQDCLGTIVETFPNIEVHGYVTLSSFKSCCFFLSFYISFLLTLPARVPCIITLLFEVLI